jgi:hypothetical protein
MDEEASLNLLAGFLDEDAWVTSCGGRTSVFVDGEHALSAGQPDGVWMPNAISSREDLKSLYIGSS